MLQKLTKKVKNRLRYELWKVNCRNTPRAVNTFTLPDGSPFRYPLNSAIGGAMFIDGFENLEVAYVRQVLQPGDIFLDIGANGGLFTVIAAKQVGPTGHVYAFEPGLRELALLRENIALNGLTNVTVIERAVSDRSGTTRFAISTDGAMNSLAQTNHPGQKIEQWLTIQTVSLDDFIQQVPLAQVNFVKMDVEGAERLIFAGGEQFFRAYPGVTLLFEASDINAVGFGYTVKDFLLFLQGLGLKLFYFDEIGQLAPIQGEDVSFGREIYNFVAISPKE
ncbi:FkbM family methyltransferase [Candidatus Cyanaurora vandensis]|uniref:FkbM family methyltransferase n=1 Tax=Candidatus Cyanaurora vandensis TaxID=2714958 RepID=UPI00257B4449|nr:FkbM family methyltransferase [Candidatus Cyanaurora vandensis]